MFYQGSLTTNYILRGFFTTNSFYPSSCQIVLNIPFIYTPCHSLHSVPLITKIEKIVHVSLPFIHYRHLLNTKLSLSLSLTLTLLSSPSLSFPSLQKLKKLTTIVSFTHSICINETPSLSLYFHNRMFP